MITIQGVLEKSIQFLIDKQVPEARRAAEEVVAISLKKPRIDLYMHFDQPLVEEELKRVRENLARRAKREPLQYILGEVSFYDAKIKLSEDVLIPRHETEILVDQIAKGLEKESLHGKVLWDLCTGSGCIAISLKKRFPDLTVIASDLSSKALKQAKANAELNQVDIVFIEGDGMDAYEQKVDYLVSNPPYLSEEEYQHLEPEVKSYEPKMSLVSGESGLEFYERIASKLKDKLNKPGKVWLEIGSTQKEGVQKIFNEKLGESGVVTPDYSGHFRFFFLELE